MLIGWASVDITPPRPVALRGQHHTRVSNSIHDPLTATALALETVGADGTREQAVLVSLDRVGVPGEIARRLCETVAPLLPDLDADKVFMNATHTHTAPELREGYYVVLGPDVMTPTEYSDFFIGRVADAVVRAWQGRAEGGVSWGMGHAVVGHNRRITYADGSSLMYGKTDREDFESVEGYEDHVVEVLFTWDEAQQLTGMAVNLACPSQVTEGDSFVSADFWHEARLSLRERFGERLFVLPQCSAAGDQSPHLLLYQGAEAAMRAKRGLTEREEIGRRIAVAVGDALEVASDDVEMVPVFKHEVKTLELPVRLVTEAEHEEAIREVARLEAETPDPTDSFAVSYRHIMLKRSNRVLERYGSQSPGQRKPTEIHVLRLGDIAIATNPFELFLDYGLRMKARSKALHTFVVQLTGSKAGDDGSYLPTARAVAGASYGAQIADNVYGPEAGRILVEETLEAINGMWEGEGG